MEIIPSRKGYPLLAMDGFMYRVDRLYPARTTWRCTDKLCSGRAVSSPPPFQNGVQRKPHNHLADQTEADVRKSVISMKEKVSLYKFFVTQSFYYVVFGAGSACTAVGNRL